MRNWLSRIRLTLKLRIPRLLTHTRKAYTSRGPDPWAMVEHRWRWYGSTPYGRTVLTIVDGPALTATVHLFGRSLFISEAVNHRLFPIIVWTFQTVEDRHERQLAEEYENDPFYGYDPFYGHE